MAVNYIWQKYNLLKQETQVDSWGTARGLKYDTSLEDNIFSYSTARIGNDGYYTDSKYNPTTSMYNSTVTSNINYTTTKQNVFLSTEKFSYSFSTNTLIAKPSTWKNLGSGQYDTLPTKPTINSPGRYKYEVSTNRYTDVRDEAYIRCDVVVKELSISKGAYIGDVKSTSRSAYPDDNYSGSYWYVYKGVDNQAPTISGSDLDLGSKTENFDIEYIVTDFDSEDVITVDIFEDTVKKVDTKTVSVGIKYIYSVNLSNFSLGQHTIKIVATDKAGEMSTRIYTFYKSNSAPTISGTDRNLGDKNTAFTEAFTVSDKNNDSVSVIVTLNGEEIKNISNAGSGEQSITISTEKLATLELGKQNEIIIRADDGKGGISYRRFTFTRINQAPIISDMDGDLGSFGSEFSYPFSITDVEKDNISAEIFLDDKRIQVLDNVEDGAGNIIKLTQSMFVRLSKGQHTIKIVAKDDKGGVSERLLTFTKKVNKLEFILKVNKTDTYAKKILAILNGVIAEGDSVSIKFCNNYADEEPLWEDITQNSLAKLAQQLTYSFKTSDTWELAIWVMVTKNSSEDVKSVIRGISGGYE